MKLAMNLHKHRNGTWYVWRRDEKFPRGKLSSLRTKDEAEARRLFEVAKQRHLEDRLIRLTGECRVKISELAKAFTEDPDRVNLSQDTLDLDRLALKQLIDAVGDKLIRSVSAEDIKTFKTTCQTRGLAPGSTNTYCRHIRAALNYAVEQGWIAKIPKIRPLKVGQPLPRVLAIDDIERLKAYAHKQDQEMARIINFSLWTGCRRSEIAGLRFENIGQGYIRFKGKGNKERSIPMLPEALNSIGQLKDIGPVFPQWDVDTYSHRFHAVAVGAGVRARLHDLRHTCATYLLKNGVPLPVVQKILGHSDIRTTQIYAQVVDELVATEMQKLKY